jgi:hypothetical protein
MGMKKNWYAQKGWDAKGMKRKRYIPKKDGKKNLIHIHPLMSF